MQERRYDNTDIFTASPSQEDILKAIKKVENKMVAIHKAGSIVETEDGTKHEVQEDGSWKLLTEDYQSGEGNRPSDDSNSTQENK